MSAPDLATEAGLAGNYPSNRFNQRERKLLESVKEYVDNSPPNNVITTEGDLIVGDSSGDAERLAVGAAGLPLVSDGTVPEYAELTADGIADDAVSAEHLDSGISFSHRVFAAGEFTTVGGDSSESISVPGALATDLAFVMLKDLGTNQETVLAAVAGTDAIAVEFTGDPGADEIVCYQLLRAAT